MNKNRKAQIIFKFITIVVSCLVLTNCASEWAQGSRCGPGYRAHDVCFNKGEQFIFIENEPVHAQKEMYRRGFRYTDPSTYHLYYY